MMCLLYIALRTILHAFLECKHSRANRTTFTGPNNSKYQTQDLVSGYGIQEISQQAVSCGVRPGITFDD